MSEGNEATVYGSGFGLTHPFDARFPHQNQNPICITNYRDYHRCRKIKGEDYLPCNYFKRAYQNACHGFKVERWDDLAERDALPFKV